MLTFKPLKQSEAPQSDLVLSAYSLQLQTLLAQSSRYFSFCPSLADGLRLGDSSAQYDRV